MLRAAFFKGRHPGLKGIFGILIQHWTKSPFSHCELVFSDGLSASSMYFDGGVRFKQVTYDPAEWDFVDLPGELEAGARAWFMQHDGKAYDFLGDIHFIVGTVAASRDKWFCSRAIADALGVEDGWQYTPGTLYSALKFKTKPLPSGFLTPGA